MADETGIVLPWEKDAMAGLEMPDGLSYPDQILYLELRMLYHQYYQKIIGRETATKEKKTAHKETSEPVEAEYDPVKTWYDEKAVNCVKWFLIFAGLEYLFFYWQQTGQMQESAAMPSMLVCAMLAGISVGKNWKWRK